MLYVEHPKSPITYAKINAKSKRKNVSAVIGLTDNHTKVTNMDGKARVLHMYDKNKPGLHILG